MPHSLEPCRKTKSIGVQQAVVPFMPGDLWLHIYEVGDVEGKFARRLARLSKDLSLAALLHHDNFNPVLHAEREAKRAAKRNCAFVSRCDVALKAARLARRELTCADLFGSDSEDFD